MSIEKMPVFKKFPAKEEQNRLVQWIENKIYKPVSRRINWLLDRVTSGAIEIIADGNGPGEDDNWRLKIADAADVAAGQAIQINELLVQRRISSVWKTANSFRET